MNNHIIPNSASNAGNTIEVPLQTSFHTPEGRFNATIRSVRKFVKQSGARGIPFVRFLFNVHVPEANLEYLAKLELKAELSEGSELWNVLCRLIGRGALQECSGKAFDLDTLNGGSCDIETQHIFGSEEHDFPYVLVSDLRPAGELVKQQITREEK